MAKLNKNSLITFKRLLCISLVCLVVFVQTIQCDDVKSGKGTEKNKDGMKKVSKQDMAKIEKKEAIKGPLEEYETFDDEDEDDSIDFSVFDKPKRRGNTNEKLEESIVKAVRKFRTDNKDFNIAAFLAGLLGKRKRRSADIEDKISEEQIETISQLPFKLNDPNLISLLTKTDVQKIVDDNAENEKVSTDDEEGDLKFDEFEDDTTTNENITNDLDAKKAEESTRSNINKIPKKRPVLSRKTKSLLNGKKAKKNFLNTTLTNDDVDHILSDSGELKNMTGVEKYFNVFSAQHLLESWGSIKPHLSSGCRQHMGVYLVGLIRRDLWALKMDDASGRYTTGYYWGNSYWSGSAVFCEHIAASMDEETTPRPQTRNDGLPQTMGHVASNHESGRPPFLPAFYMAKMHLHVKESHTGPHIIQLGMCLPSNCSTEDIFNLLNHTKSSVSSQVLAVRAPHLHYYNMFHDLTFQLLAGVSVIVLGLMIAGTIYELALGPRLVQQNAHTSTPPAARHNTNNHHHQHNNTVQVNNERQQLQSKADETSSPALPIVKMSNGKSIYSLNTNNNNSEERLNIELNSNEEATTLNIFSELILSFSVISNMKTICDQSVGSDTIPTIHGLRSISMAWVILGHTCIIAFKYADNPGLRYDVEKEFLFQTVTNGAFSVDTFFCISGILVSYLYFRTNSKGSLDRLTKGTKGFISGVITFIGLLAYRFARLTTPYMFMLGVVEVSTKWFASNSVFEPPTLDHENCPNYWWRNVLYINTLFPVEQMCMLWSWYLADDSQFYVLGAVILILAASHFKTAAGALSLFLVSSWFTTAYIAWTNNHMPSTDDPLALFDKIYDKPWTRLGPYLIGMAAGWYLFKTNCRIRMSKFTVFCGWLFSTSVLICLVYGLYNTNLTPVTAAAYSSLSHTAWAIAVAWIVIACSTGYGGYINNILSATILYPFSRVTYCAYLVHPVVIRFLAMHIDHPMHLGKAMMVVVFLGQMLASFALSFVISLAFEAPIVTMLKILAPNRRKKIH